jgi:hypothetical protein
VWVSTQQVNYLSYVLHSSFTVLEKKWEYNEAVDQLFIDIKKVYDSIRRAVKLVRLIKMSE